MLKSKRVKVNIFIFCILCFYLNCNKSYSEDVLQMFSSKIDKNNNILLVVKNDSIFVRKVINGKYEYNIPDDGCYKTLDNLNICVKNKMISSIEGNVSNVASKNKITTNRLADEFYNEKNINCNIMKFDIINKLLVKKEQIDGFGMQIYLPDYYSVLRLFMYKDENDNLKAFIISDRNDVGCSPFYDYKIHKQEENYNNLKKNKKLEIKNARTTKEYLKKLSTESYKKMLLKGYVYIKPTNSIYDVEKIVLSIKNDDVSYVNVVSIDLEWKKIGFNDIYSN